MKRLFDIVVSFVLLIILLIPMVLILVAIRITSKGPSLYWSRRVGQDGVIFNMPKFRSMKVETPALATHLIGNPNESLSPIGGFLRSYSLDEFPQLFSIFKGDMSFVGPRPALFNQEDLIVLRKNNGVDKLVPGLTGWAQVNGRDNLSIPEKVELDVEYLKRKSLWFDFKILVYTLIKAIMKEGVKH